MLNQIEVFYYVAKLASFSKAAVQLNVSKSHVSKTIQQLEHELKARLFARTTRQLTLTEAGHIFFQHCSKIMGEAEKGYNLVNELQNIPTGTLKISAPPALGTTLLPAIVAEFMRQYSSVKLIVNLESKLIDVVGEGYDLVLRAAVLPDSTLIAQKILKLNNVICATPQYLKKNPTLLTPNDLLKHNCAVYYLENAMVYWSFIKDNHQEQILIHDQLRSNQMEFIKQLVLENSCVGQLPWFMVKEEVKAKKLVVCLPNYQLLTNDLYVIFPAREYIPPKVKLFIQVLKNQLNKL